MIRRRRSLDLSTERLEAFTDGVFAIAATLLVLDLTDHSLGEVGTDAQMGAALGGMWELFLNFGLSFILLCLMWRVHVQQFEHIKRVDTAMIWLNNIRLLFIALVPFATAVTTEYSDFLAGRLMMPVAFLLAIASSWAQWWWAVAHADTMLPEMDRAEAIAYGHGSSGALIIGVVVVALSPWLGSWAFLLFALDGPLTRALRGRTPAGQDGDEPSAAG